MNVRRAVVSIAVVSLLGLALWPGVAVGQTGDSGNGGDARANNNGTDVTGTAIDNIPGASPVGTNDSTGGAGGVQCWYTPLRYTTQEQQRTDIRPEEQREGSWGWLVCDDGRPDEFMFFPDGAPLPQVDPRQLAESVTITPTVTGIRTSPPLTGRQLVNLETWYWLDEFETISKSKSAGAVTVTVTAIPRSIVVDPGDGTGAFACEGPGTAYNPALSPASQSSNCTHTYRHAGQFTGTVTVIYDVAFSSNVGAGGPLGTIEPDASFGIDVAESQAVVVG